MWKNGLKDASYLIVANKDIIVLTVLQSLGNTYAWSHCTKHKGKVRFLKVGALIFIQNYETHNSIVHSKSTKSCLKD